MTQTRYYLVVLLVGNQCSIPLPQNEVASVETFMKDCMGKSMSDPGFFISYQGYHILARNILGFYIKTV